MTCCLPDCTRPVHARGLCNSHYETIRRHGEHTRYPSLRRRDTVRSSPEQRAYWRRYYQERKARIAREIANGR